MLNPLEGEIEGSHGVMPPRTTQEHLTLSIEAAGFVNQSLRSSLTKPRDKIYGDFF